MMFIFVFVTAFLSLGLVFAELLFDSLGIVDAVFFPLLAWLYIPFTAGIQADLLG